MHTRQMHSLAEHEAEMQRQMMSVQGSGPPSGPPNLRPPPNMGGPPPNMNHTNNIVQHPNMGPPHMGQPPNHPHNFAPPPGQNQPGPPQNNLVHPPGSWIDDATEALELQPLMSMKVDKPDDLKNKSSGEVVLPKALEDVFAFKDQLADELGRTDGEIPVETERSVQKSSTGVISTDYADADADSDEEEFVQQSPTVSKQQHRLDKNKKKKLRKKQNRQQRQAKQAELEEKQEKAPEKGVKENGSQEPVTKNGDVEDEVTVEYVPDKITVAELAPMYRQFYRVFELFKLEEKAAIKEQNEIADEKAAQLKKDKDKLDDDDDEDMDEDKPEDKEKLSKRKLKKLTRLSVAELKQLVNRPDVVEMHDVTARDPKLLVQLKAHRNTVQVPRHWCFKRKYLQGKRGIEKPPFDLPAFIKKTGIMEMRASLQEKDEAKTLKAKMRERARPKMGKIDIDYQKLHDAFFK